MDVGYRLRLKNDRVDRDPGDEWFYLGEIGYEPIRKLLVALKIEGIHGKPATNFGIETVQDVKRVTYLSPVLLVMPIPNLSLEAALRVSLNGRNFPAGYLLVLGMSYSGGPLTGR